MSIRHTGSRFERDLHRLLTNRVESSNTSDESTQVCCHVLRTRKVHAHYFTGFDFRWCGSTSYESSRIVERSRSALPEVKIREIMIHEPSSFLKRGNKLQSIRLKHFTIRLDSHTVDPRYRKSRTVK